MKILISEQQLKSIVKSQQKGAILIGGLDDRTDKDGKLIDKTIDQQISLLKTASGFSNIIGLRYSTSDGDIMKTILNNPNFPIVLFSAGCQKADVVLNTNGVNPNKVFLIQPWAASKKRMDYYNGLRMPKNHIYVGKSASTGNGISGATRCPEGMSHWGSLPAIGGMVLKLM
jgi:hypothetical protein